MLGLLGHLEKGFSKKCRRNTGASEVEGRSKSPLSLILDGVEEHRDILFPESPFIIEVREVPGQVAHLFRLQSLFLVQYTCRLVPLVEYRKAVGQQADQSLLDVAGLELEAHANYTNDGL